MGSNIAITFDIDWAPDWCILQCADACRKRGAAATFFVTHLSPAVEELLADPLFEVGIHPNFLSGSSHGEDPEEVLAACLAMAPNARSLRSHSLVQSSRIFAVVADRFPNLVYDVSLLLPLHPGLRPTPLYIGESRRPIVRLPFFWEDDLFGIWPGWRWSEIPDGEGLRIFNFHPIYVSLNAAGPDAYNGLKAALDGRSLYSAEPELIKCFANTGAGAGRYLDRLLDAYPGGAFRTISDLGDEWCRMEKP